MRIINVGSVERRPAAAASFAHATWIESTAAGLRVEAIEVPLGGDANAAELSALR